MAPKRALRWVIFWFMIAMGVMGGIFRFYGTEKGIEFLTCYLLEWTLSIDNLFVFLMIFNSFGVDPHRQLRALNWGIIGAIILRFTFILLGVTLVNLFEPILYFFGVLLLYSAYQMAFTSHEGDDVKNNRLARWIRKRFPMTKNFHGDRFLIHRQGRWIMTPMLLVVIVIETSDIMFAIDSVPAAFAVTRNPWIIFIANMCAIMGLRSLYFLLAHAEQMFGYLKYGISFILAFVGVKMLLFQVIHSSPYLKYVSLGVVLLSLAVSIMISLIARKR